MALKVAFAFQGLCSLNEDSRQWTTGQSASFPGKQTAQQAGGVAGAPGAKRSTLGVCDQVLLGAHSERNVSDQLLHSSRELELCCSQKEKQ